MIQFMRSVFFNPIDSEKGHEICSLNHVLGLYNGGKLQRWHFVLAIAATPSGNKFCSLTELARMERKLRYLGKIKEIFVKSSL